MPKKKQPSKEAFTSFRILGKKAQRLIERAKERMHTENVQQQSAPMPAAPEGISVTVHLSVKSVVQAALAILLVILGAWLLVHIRSKIVLLLLGVFVAVLIDPGVSALERGHVPRPVAILIHYLIALLLVFFLVFSFIPIIALQLQQISQFFSQAVNTFLADPTISLPLLSQEMNQQLSTLVEATLSELSINEFTDALRQVGQNLSPENIYNLITSIGGSVGKFIASLVIVLVLAFFLQMEKEMVSRWARSLFPPRARAYVDEKAGAIHMKIGQWARGELMLMCCIFSLTLLALIILRMPYALTLAALAGFCEFIPAVGPFIAAVPAVLIALTQQGFLWAAAIMGVYYVIQWCENNLLVPLIMKRAVGLSPIAILFAMMVGISFAETIHPILGVMLAIPATTIITLFLQDWISRNK